MQHLAEQTIINEILTKFRTIAVVGLSRDPTKDSYKVSSYLKTMGYTIIPLNPYADQILGEKSYNCFFDMPSELKKRIEIVTIFRPSNVIPAIVEEVIKLRNKHGCPYVIWMQLNIINDLAAQEARNSGMQVVMNRCMMVEHKRLLNEK